jgi:nucleoside-diphosphate-sugar epimerase
VKAFVTGATGFVGGHLVRALLEAGMDVTAMVRSIARGRDIASQGAALLQADLSDPAVLTRAMAGHDLVFHVAGLIAARNEAEFLAVNRDGTATLLTAIAAAQVRRLVLVSSQAAGGPSAGGPPLRGHEPPHPVTAYGRSKLAAEAVVRRSTLDWTIVRPPAVYGPGDREMFRLFKAAARGLGPVFGDGSMRLSLIYGPDLAAALVAAGVSTGTIGGTYYAAHPEILSSRDVLIRIGQAAGRNVRIVRIPHWVGRAALQITGAAARLAGRATVLTADKANEFFQAAWTCDSAPLTEATGWRAQHDLAAGAELTLAWYRERRWI